MLEKGLERNNLGNYKGEYHNECCSNYIDPETGAHFDFYDMCRRLKSFAGKLPFLSSTQPIKAIPKSEIPRPPGAPRGEHSCAKQRCHPGRIHRLKKVTAEAVKNLGLVLNRLDHRFFPSSSIFKKRDIFPLSPDSIAKCFQSETFGSEASVLKSSVTCTQPQSTMKTEKLNLKRLLKNKPFRGESIENLKQCPFAALKEKTLPLRDLILPKRCPSECVAYSQKRDLSFEVIFPQRPLFHTKTEKSQATMNLPNKTISRNLAQKQNHAMLFQFNASPKSEKSPCEIVEQKSKRNNCFAANKEMQRPNNGNLKVETMTKKAYFLISGCELHRRSKSQLHPTQS